MKNMKMLLFMVMIVILSSPFASATDLRQQQPTALTKMFDLLIIRPLCIPLSAASTALYLGTIPFTFPAGVSEPAARILVEAPWRFTGARYLGEFNHYRDEKPITIVPE